MHDRKAVDLYFTEGASDKVYSVRLQEGADGWSVAIAYGRRGKALKTGSKGAGLTEAKARQVFDKIVAQEMPINESGP